MAAGTSRSSLTARTPTSSDRVSPPPSAWLSPGQAARVLDVSPQRVHQLAADDELKFVVTALGKLFDPESVERLRARRAR
jgi:hypothetical protein